jgi:tRNA (cytidine/uridine-2'-O-)-methyltransferase
MNVVLVEPEIPPNTGNVARLCAATGATLHLVGPLGFRLDDRELKRAGMDYWEQVTWKYWESLEALQIALRKGEGGGMKDESRTEPTPDPSKGGEPNAVSPLGRGKGWVQKRETPRFWYVTTKAKRAYTEPRYKWGDYLVFGRETAGLPSTLLEANPETTITIPMFNPQARSLNLATAVAIILYEAVRQVKGF